MSKSRIDSYKLFHNCSLVHTINQGNNGIRCIRWCFRFRCDGSVWVWIIVILFFITFRGFVSLQLLVIHSFVKKRLWSLFYKTPCDCIFQNYLELFFLYYKLFLLKIRSSCWGHLLYQVIDENLNIVVTNKLFTTNVTFCSNQNVNPDHYQLIAVNS